VGLRKTAVKCLALDKLGRPQSGQTLTLRIKVGDIVHHSMGKYVQGGGVGHFHV
jgi:hypothetical protein